jgi:hypothetical protein
MSQPLRLRFLASASRRGQLPDSPAEVAFVGRSNVGKSSLINALANTKQLARVSNTPGRTQLINIFELEEPGRAHGTVVDLPGYGYAKVPGRIRKDWPEMIEGYPTATRTAPGGPFAYIVYEDERYTYAEVARAGAFARPPPRDVHGVGSGDRVAIAMRNYPEWVVGYWATSSRRCRGGRHERLVDRPGDGVRPHRLASPRS